MKTKMAHLGVILLTILFLVSAGSLALFFTDKISDRSGIALGVILLFVAVTFVGYMLFDLYVPLRTQRRKKPHDTAAKSVADKQTPAN